MNLKTAFRETLKSFGYDVVKLEPTTHPLARRARLMETFGVTLVLDVGANTGQYAKQLRAIGYRGKIVSFEPLRSAYRELAAFAERDPLWTPVNIALGSESTRLDINVSANSYSSSLMSMLDSHQQSAPDSRYIGKEEVSVARLDSILGEYCSRDDVLYLKIDTQGYERHVLDGAKNVLDSIRSLQLEMSLVPLYQDQPLLHEIEAFLRGSGYTLVALEPGFSDPATGQLLQVDGIFHRF